MLKDIFKSSLYIGAGVFLAKILSVSYTLFLARVLGPENMGAFILSLLMVSWFSIVASLSVQTVSTQLIAEYNVKGLDIRKPISAALIIGTSTAIIATIIHFSIADFVAVNLYHDALLSKYLKLASLIILGTVIFYTALGIERGLKKFKSYAAIESGKQIIMLIFGSLFLFGFSWRIGGAILAAVIAPAIIALLAYFRYAKYLMFEFSTELRKVFYLGANITILSIFISIFLSIDKFILGILTTKEIVGFYVPAVTIVTFIGMFLPGAIKNASLPYIVESYTKGKLTEVRKYAEKILVYYNVLVGFLVIPVMFFRWEGISITFGNDYLPATEPLAVILFSTFYFSMFIIMHTFIISIDKIKEGTVATASTLGLALLTNYFFVNMYGLMGAAYALVINVLFLALAYSIILKKAMKLRTRRIALSIIILNAVFLMSYYLSFSSSVVLRIILICIVITLYTGLLLLFKLIGLKEINFAVDKVYYLAEKYLKIKSKASAIAVIGLGKFAENTHLPAIRKSKFRVKYLISKSGERAKKLAKIFNAESTDLDTALNDKEIKLAYITSADAEHAKNIISATKYNKPIFCEKPLALTEKDCKKIAQIIKDKNLLFALGLNKRHTKLSKYLKSVLNEQKKPITIRWSFNEILKRNESGKTSGAIRIICHYADLTCWLLDTDIISVYAKGNPQNFTAVAKLLDGSTLEISYSTLYEKSDWRERCDIIAPGLELAIKEFTEVSIFRNGKIFKKIFSGSKGYEEQLNELHKALNGWPADFADLKQAIRSAEFGFAILKSLKQKREIKFK